MMSNEMAELMFKFPFQSVSNMILSHNMFSSYREEKEELFTFSKITQRGSELSNLGPHIQSSHKKIDRRFSILRHSLNVELLSKTLQCKIWSNVREKRSSHKLLRNMKRRNNE